MSETPKPTSAREVFTALPHLLTDPYIPEVHGDLDDEPESMSPERLAEIARMQLGDWYAGPWTQDPAGVTGVCRVYHEESDTVLAELPDWAGSIALWMADAHDAVPALLAEVERRGARIAELERAAVEGRYSLADLVEEHTDPGTAALGALWLLRQATTGLALPADQADEVLARHVATACEKAIEDRDDEMERLRERIEELVQQRDDLLAEDARREMADDEPGPCRDHHPDDLATTPGPVTAGRPTRTERSYWVAIADALNSAAQAGMPVGIDLDGTLTDRRAWSVIWDRDATQWAVAGYDDEDDTTEAGDV